MASVGFVEALEALRRADVELVVVGMASAILQGTPAVTQDIDIVHRRTPENVDRLLKVLDSLGAVYRTDTRGIRPTSSYLLGTGHNLFKTIAGDLDCLGTIDDGRLGYEELVAPRGTPEVVLGLRIQKRVELQNGGVPVTLIGTPEP